MNNDDDLMPRVLTTGRLDGLTITPVINDQGHITSLYLTVNTMPGLHISLEAGAACELRDSLTAVLQLRPIASYDQNK